MKPLLAWRAVGTQSPPLLLPLVPNLQAPPEEEADAAALSAPAACVRLATGGEAVEGQACGWWWEVCGFWIKGLKGFAATWGRACWLCLRTSLPVRLAPTLDPWAPIRLCALREDFMGGVEQGFMAMREDMTTGMRPLLWEPGR